MSETQNIPENTTQAPVPNWFWAVSVVALIWNLMGIMAFIAQIMITPQALAAMSEPERALIENMPQWAYIAFAIAVFCGTLGCIGLLMRKSWAPMMFKFSIIGIILQNFNAFLAQDSFTVFGPGGTMMVILVLIVAIALLWLSLRAKNNDWLA